MHGTKTEIRTEREPLVIDEIDAYVQEIVDAAPPLTATQIVQLKRVFRQ